MTEKELYVTEDTTVEELLEYVRHVVENPYRVETPEGEKVVWNFATHDLREDKLDLEGKECDEFVIPFQVTSTWGMMYTLLPERVREGENLIWHRDDQTYYAYNQLYRKMSVERREEFKKHLAKDVGGVLGPA